MEVFTFLLKILVLFFVIKESVKMGINQSLLFRNNSDSYYKDQFFKLKDDIENKQK